MARLAKEAVLELETRKKLYDAINNSPGLHFRELERRIGIAYGTLQYHLEYLIKHNLVEEEKGKDYSRYFPSEFKSIIDKELLSILRQQTLRRILLFLIENPGQRNKDLAAKIGLSPSTVSWHMSRLVRTEAVTEEVKENEVSYKVNEPEVVIKLLVKYKSSFIDKVVDNFIEVWEREKPV